LGQRFLDESIRAVFFDAVGTLLFPAEPVVETYRRIARKHGASIDEATIHARLRESFAAQERFDATADWRTSEEREVDRWQRIVTEALCEASDPRACFLDLWEHYRHPAAWRCHPETAQALAELTRRGIVVGMASNFDARLAAIVNATKELEPVRDRLVISSLAGWRKPSGEFFREVVQLAGVAPERILFVGDDLRNDLEGARAAGLRGLLLDSSGKADVTDRIAILTEIFTG
jgi:putative hydrolase of the HAD superfamily